MHGNRSMPASTIIPELPYLDVYEAVEWLCQAFGFTERLRIGTHRAQLTFGSGAIVVTQGSTHSVSCALMVRVDDVDRHHAQSVQAGAPILHPPTDYPYGERQYTTQDLGGHRWTFSQTIRVNPRPIFRGDKWNTTNQPLKSFTKTGAVTMRNCATPSPR